MGPIKQHLRLALLAAGLLGCAATPPPGKPQGPADVIIADFEQGHFVGFSAQGLGFGAGPQFSTETGSNPIQGFVGQGFASSWIRGLPSVTGALRSDTFAIERSYINFLAGGLYDPTTVAIRLLVDDKVVRESSGNAGDGFQVAALTWFFWDVREFLHRPARIEIIDDNSAPSGYVLVDEIVMSARPPARRDQSRTLKASAEEARTRLSEQFVDRDQRPVFHLMPTAGWMGNPTAAIHHNGVSHLFFQHNPYAATPGDTYWGHIRTTDGVRWERDPDALAPAYDEGESQCLSGSAITQLDGKLRLFYSSVGPRPLQVWTALAADADAKIFEKSRDKPAFAGGARGTSPLSSERDPYVFRIRDSWYLVVGGKNQESKGAVALYRSSDLKTWQFVGIPFSTTEGPLQAPMFLPLDGRWVLFHSDRQRARYATGALDLETGVFQVQHTGMVDEGMASSGKTAVFQAPRLLTPLDGKSLLIGQLDVASADQSWRGALSVARSLSLHSDGTLLQRPAETLANLRSEGLRIAEQRLKESAMRLDGVSADAFDLSVTLTLGDARRAGLKMRRSRDGGRAVIVGFDGQKLLVDDQVVALSQASPTISLRILVDRGVMEIFINEGDLVISRTLRAKPDETGFELFSAGGEAVFSNLEIHPMGSIWR
jgi:beta-fructofuranosidase